MPDASTVWKRGSQQERGAGPPLGLWSGALGRTAHLHGTPAAVCWMKQACRGWLRRAQRVSGVRLCLASVQDVLESRCTSRDVGRTEAPHTHFTSTSNSCLLTASFHKLLTILFYITGPHISSCCLFITLVYYTTPAKRCVWVCVGVSILCFDSFICLYRIPREKRCLIWCAQLGKIKFDLIFI